MACLIWIAIPDLGLLDDGLPNLPDLVVSRPSLAGAGAGVGTITIAGSFLGLQYEMLLAGLAGGLAMLSSLPPVSRPRAVMILITSALMGGYVGPMLHAWAIQSDVFAWSGK